MAKRELSNTLKNLKFMQRAAQKDDKPKKEEEEVIPTGDFPASYPVKRCVVIAEGDPHPGPIRGRMSFLSFNPSIDKLNKVESSVSETESAATTSSGRQNEEISIRENGSPQDRLDSELDAPRNDGNLKRRSAEAASPSEYPHKWRKNDEDNHDSSSSRSRSSKKRDKLDWNVLRPPKSQSKRR